MTEQQSTDGKTKMSKTMGNTINLGSNPAHITTAVKSMYTDPTHLKIEDPGRVEGNVVFTYLEAFHPDTIYINELKKRYQSGGLGDGTTKKILEECLQEILRPIRHEREKLLSEPSYLLQVLAKGSEVAKFKTEKTLYNIKSVFGLNIF